MSIDILTGEPVNRSIPHISLHQVTRFEPITAAHFDQRYNKYKYIVNRHSCLFSEKLALYMVHTFHSCNVLLDSFSNVDCMVPCCLLVSFLQQSSFSTLSCWSSGVYLYLPHLWSDDSAPTVCFSQLAETTFACARAHIVAGQYKICSHSSFRGD